MYDCPTPQQKPFYFSFNLASIIKLPQNPRTDVPYEDLVCTEQDQEKIVEIITTIAENNKFILLLKQTHLRSLGAQLNHVHPLKFVAVSVGTPYLKCCIALIFDDYFKKSGFMDGLGSSLTREAEKKKLDVYLAQFAAEIDVPPEDIQGYITTRDWEGLMHFLMHYDSNKRAN